MYSKLQAQKLAQKVQDLFGERITNACKNSLIPESFLAGFVSVECGKTRAGNFNELATRYEAHVYGHLIRLRDTGKTNGKTTYNKITRAQIKDCTDAAIKALATSYGATQIMGWHTVNNLDCELRELRNPQLHLRFAVRLLYIVAKPYLEKGDFASVLRIWNTGKPNGKTHDADYVSNALSVKTAYEKLLKTRKPVISHDSDDSPEIIAPHTNATNAATVKTDDAEDEPSGDAVSDPAPEKDVKIPEGAASTTQTTVLTKERVPLSVRLWTTVTASIAAITGFGVSLQSTVDRVSNSITGNQTVILIFVVIVIAIAVYVYDRAANRAHARNVLKAETAADKYRNNIEWKT